MGGKEAIIEKIKAEARIKANSTLEEGAKKAKDEIEIANNDAKIYKEKNMAESYEERSNILKRKETVANLEVKKLFLQAKKEVIDKAFKEAVEAIKKDEASYKALVSRMISFAEDGDEIVVAKADEKILTEKFLTETAKKCGKEIKKFSVSDAFEGGIVLKGNGVDKNLTLENELTAVRNEYEVEIADILFGE